MVLALAALVPQVRESAADAVQSGLGDSVRSWPTWPGPDALDGYAGGDEVGEAASGDTSPSTGVLQPERAHAWEHASAEAASADHPLEITSGYRSAERQQELFDEAIVKYGSAEAASKWVLPPDESSHVTGRAIDVGPEEHVHWLADNGVRHDLCQPYAWEPWHFEYRPEWVSDGACPSPAEG